MTQPKVTVLMSVCNRADYVGSAVNSILNQSLTNFEFIIIDDGSRDGSWEVLLGYSKQDSRIRLIKQDNSGLPTALNQGIAIAEAEYIARMDDDDIAHLDRLEKQVWWLDNNPYCVALGGSARLIDEDGDVYGQYEPPIEHAKIEQRLLSAVASALLHPTAIMRRSALLEIGGYTEKYRRTQDLDLFLRLAEIGQLANLQAWVIDYRRIPENPNKIGYQHYLERMKVRYQIIESAMYRRGRLEEFSGIRNFSMPSSVGEVHAQIGKKALENHYWLCSLKHLYRLFVHNPNPLSDEIRSFLRAIIIKLRILTSKKTKSKIKEMLSNFNRK